jgi:outer membrane protein OmpA-like peptidoglycan-associated protein
MSRTRDESSANEDLGAAKRSSRVKRAGAATLGAAAALLLSGACASTHSSTQPCQAWSGTCKLSRVGKVAEHAAPVPFVVYEGLYEPVGAPASVHEARVRLEARAIHEGALQAHFSRYAEVACQQTVDAECFPGATSAAIPAFTPPEEKTDTGPVGCARLEREDLNVDPAASRKGAEALPEQIDFQPNTTEVSPESRADLEGVAARLLGDPSLECVAIVSQSAPGEPAGLAEQRTWAIRRQLIERGVPTERLQTIALQPAFSGPAADPGGMPVERKVRFKVLLRK